MNTTRLVIPLLFLAIAGACAPANRPPKTVPHAGAGNVISAEQISAFQSGTVYDAVERLRPNWLRVRGVQSISTRSAGVIVYLNQTRFGGIASLRTIATSTVSAIHYHDATTAQFRFGIGHDDGVIQVITTPKP